jgi:hypothetical protein
MNTPTKTTRNTVAPAAFTRRSFLSAASLGGTATLLSPLVGGLLNEAQGQPVRRQLALFYVFGVGFHPDWEFTPTDLKGKAPSLAGPTNFAWPTALGPLESLRGRTLLIDGLSNPVKTTNGHQGGFGALSCRTAAQGANNGRALFAGGISIDQHVAETLGAGTALPSVRFGVHGRGWAPVMQSVFAFGPDRPASHILDPVLFHRTLFGKVTGGQDPTQNKSDTVLLDAIAGQVRRLQGQLAGAERAKLDEMLTAIGQLEKRQAAGLRCATVPKAPAAVPTDGPRVPEDALEAMMSMSLAAAICGLTNVICVADGAPGGHGSQTRWKRIAAGTQFASQGYVSQPDHDAEDTGRPKRQIVRRYQTGVLADAARVLQGVKVGDQTLFDQAVMLFMSENGDDHHSRKARWPLVLLGNAGGKLKTDGRFLHYPNQRALGDLFSTLATALGRPTDDFGKGGNAPTQGPLTELLA